MRSAFLALLAAGAAGEAGGWPDAPGAVAPFGLVEEDAQPESADAALRDLKPGPAAQRVELELLDDADVAADPAFDKVREQVQMRMNAVQEGMAQLKGVIGNTRKRAAAMGKETDRIRNEMHRAMSETSKQKKMYSAGAQNENRLHQFDESLMEHLDQARGMEAELTRDHRAQKQRMKNETEEKEMTMAMILDWMNQKNGTDNEAGEPLQGTFQYTNLEFEMLKEKSVRMTDGVNANARELSDIIDRTAAMEAEARKAMEVLNTIQYYFTERAMTATVKNQMDEEREKEVENGAPEALLQEAANVTQVAPPAPSSLAATVESWLPVLPAPRWPGDAAGASVGAFNPEGAV